MPSKTHLPRELTFHSGIFPNFSMGMPDKHDLCEIYRHMQKKGNVLNKLLVEPESCTLLPVYRTHSKLFLQIFRSFLRYFAILPPFQSVGKCIRIVEYVHHRNIWKRQPDCKYLIRTENHSGKFDIFILFYVLRNFSTFFHFFYVRPRRTRASNTCELMFFAHM